MTTQHQAPEVTSEDRELTSAIYRHFGFNGGTNLDLSNPVLQMVAAHRTRATQPLSLTVDEGIVEAVATAIWENDCATYLPVQWENDPGHWRRYARAALDRLQSLSLPVDIDRSGLAQEVDDISYAGVGP